MRFFPGFFPSWKVLHYFAHYSFASEASNQCYSPTNSLPAEGAEAALSIILLTQPFVVQIVISAAVQVVPQVGAAAFK